MNAMLGHQVGPQLVEALGLPRNTTGFTLRCYANEVVSVTCEYWPEDSGLADALSQCNLVAVGGTLPRTEAFDFDAWMRERTERAHREFMERTSRLLPCDLKLVPAAAIRGYLGDSRY
jgi:hypothetical protein